MLWWCYDGNKCFFLSTLLWFDLTNNLKNKIIPWNKKSSNWTVSYSVRDYISAAMLKTDTDCEVSSSYLSEHVPAVGVPVQGQVLVQDPQSMLFKDGCDVHSALHRGDGLVEDGVHKDHSLFWGRTCRTEKKRSLSANKQVGFPVASSWFATHLHSPPVQFSPWLIRLLNFLENIY